MKIRELLNEAPPLSDYQPLGDFDKPGPFRHITDKRLVTHPKTRLKAEKFFSRSPYNFRLFFSNISGTASKHKESGEASLDLIRNIFKDQADTIIHNHDDAITVVFLGNYGAERVMITPWIMAHRLGHAIQASRFPRGRYGPTTWTDAEHAFFSLINQILHEVYGKASGYKKNKIEWELRSEYNALFNAIGTQRSSRTGQINRPYEFLYELFAQYIQDGVITLNPLPKRLPYGKKAWGRHTNYLRARVEDDSLESESQHIARLMEDHFNTVLSSCVGKIYLM